MISMRSQGVAIFLAGSGLTAWGAITVRVPLVLLGLFLVLFGAARARWLPIGKITVEADALKATRVARWVNVLIPVGAIGVVLTSALTPDAGERLLTALLATVLALDIGYYVWLARFARRRGR